MKPFLITVAISIGVTLNLISLFLVAYFGEFPLPVSSTQFHTDWHFKSLVTQGDQIIGGGYSFAEARDVWIRIRLSHEPDLDSDPTGEACSPETLEKIRAWFLEQAASPQKIFGVVTLSEGSQVDKTVLNDIANLRCKSPERSAPIIQRLGEFPQGCSSPWILYHQPSHFYYERSSCSN